MRVSFSLLWPLPLGFARTKRKRRREEEERKGISWWPSAMVYERFFFAPKIGFASRWDS